MTMTKNQTKTAAAHLVGQALIHANASALLAKETNGDVKSFAAIAEESEAERRRRMAPSMAAARIGSDGRKPLSSREVSDLSRLSKSTSDRWCAFGAALLLLPEAKRTVAAVEAVETFTKKITDGPEGLTQAEVEHAAKGLSGDLDAIVVALTAAKAKKAEAFAKAQAKRDEAKAKAEADAAAKAKAEADAQMTPEEAALAKAAEVAEAAKALIAAIVAAPWNDFTSEDMNGLIDAVNVKVTARKAHRAAEAAKVNAAEAAKVTPKRTRKAPAA